MIIIQKIFSYLLDIAQTIIIAGVLFLITYIFFFRPYQVSGSSMHPTFVDKEYVLTSIISLRIEKIKRGDVIVFQAPNQENEEFKKDYIKRIIGTAGDSIEIKDGNVYVNNQKLDESAYLSPEVKTYGGAFMKEGIPVTVSNNSYLVLGDNRPASSDSREWGFIKENEIIGKSVFVYLPVNQMRLVKNPFK
ncbi:MAG: signal peptidase I [Candidatus Levyibacteriota bacterium]|nr:MAG: signal peptidase I [Candidatus Levybacteria bacterium]